jgi:glutamate N-acetyltransferase/amino-acid acetyltransferase
MTATASSSFVVSTSLDGELAIPAGFRFAGVHAHIKRSRKDLGLIHCTAPQGAEAAGVFTRNPVRAACVNRCAALLPASGVRAVIVNSGNANAMTGELGVQANLAMAQAVAGPLECSSDAVLSCSTGVIGVPLDAGKIATAMPSLLAELDGSSSGPRGFAAAILTTDIVTKVAHGELWLPGVEQPIRLFGVAKGSGMIHPNMATTLGYVCTDAAIEHGRLQALLRRAIDTTFNAITVDGDTSTNDTILAFATGGVGGAVIDDPDDPRLADLRATFDDLMRDLAMQVVKDGEGISRLFHVTVTGAADDAAARRVARAITESPLVKTAVAGGDPNWGRIVMAAGKSGVAFAEADLAISYGGRPVARGGLAAPEFDQAALAAYVAGRELDITVAIGVGPGRFTMHACDLTHGYIACNADYTT